MKASKTIGLLTILAIGVGTLQQVSAMTHANTELSPVSESAIVKLDAPLKVTKVNDTTSAVIEEEQAPTANEVDQPVEAVVPVETAASETSTQVMPEAVPAVTQEVVAQPVAAEATVATTDAIPTTEPEQAVDTATVDVSAEAAEARQIMADVVGVSIEPLLNIPDADVISAKRSAEAIGSDPGYSYSLLQVLYPDLPNF